MQIRTAVALLGAPVVLLLVACGQQDGEEKEPSPSTPFGSQDAVQAYLAQIDPFINEIGQIHARWEEALGSRGEGTLERQGTGRNLAATAAKVEPEMKQLLARVDEIEPPPLLVPFHRDTRKLVVLRLEAYAATQEGWQAESEERDFQAAYEVAQNKVREANEHIHSLNRQMQQIRQALQKVQQPAQAAQGS